MLNPSWLADLSKCGMKVCGAAKPRIERLAERSVAEVMGLCSNPHRSAIGASVIGND